MVARPWRQYQARSRRMSPREIARLARNSIWSFRRPPHSSTEWTSVLTLDRGDIPESAFRLHASTFCIGVRSAAWLEYLQACPLMECSLFTLRQVGVPRGYFLLNQVAGQCRIIDLAVNSEAPHDWEEAYRAAVAAAFAHEATCEIMTVSSLPWLSDAFTTLGFLPRGQSPVMLYDPSGKLTSAPPLHLRMTDNDAYYLYEEARPFLT